MTDELISRQTALEDFEKCNNENPKWTPQRVKTLLVRQPSVDAVEVVRCKDCHNGRPINKLRSPERYYRDDCVVCECERVVGDEPMIYQPMHFCSYGERKEDNAN